MSVAGALIGPCFSVVVGAQLLFHPASYLRLIDWLSNDLNKTAAWRKDINKWQYKLMGLSFLAFGVYLVVRIVATVVQKLT